MLAVVKKPHIEMVISGDDGMSIIDLIRTKFDVRIIDDATDDDEEYVDIFETDFWKETTPGDLLAGCRLKYEMTQKQVAAKAGVPQSLVSDYENGKKKLTRKAAIKFGKVFNEDPDKFFPDFVKRNTE